MGFLHDIDGVGVDSDTFQLEFSYDLRPGRWFQVFIIVYIDTGSLWRLLILGFLQCEMRVTLFFGTGVIHHSNFDETNAKHSLYYMSIEIHGA